MRGVRSRHRAATRAPRPRRAGASAPRCSRPTAMTRRWALAPAWPALTMLRAAAVACRGAAGRSPAAGPSPAPAAGARTSVLLHGAFARAVRSRHITVVGLEVSRAAVLKWGQIWHSANGDRLLIRTRRCAVLVTLPDQFGHMLEQRAAVKNIATALQREPPVSALLRAVNCSCPVAGMCDTPGWPVGCTASLEPEHRAVPQALILCACCPAGGT